jgi:hypothetical protein
LPRRPTRADPLASLLAPESDEPDILSALLPATEPHERVR